MFELWKEKTSTLRRAHTHTDLGLVVTGAPPLSRMLCQRANQKDYRGFNVFQVNGEDIYWTRKSSAKLFRCITVGGNIPL